MIGHGTAVGIVSENWSGIRTELNGIVNYKVVIITHPRYLELCKPDNERLRKFFIDNRHTLIIDEQINVPISSFNKNIYGEILDLLPQELHRSLIDVTDSIFGEFDKQQLMVGNNNKIVPYRPIICLPLVNKLMEEVEANRDNVKDIYKVRKFINDLKYLNTYPCLYNNKTISCLDPNVQLWSLENNVILDANGEIDKRYDCSKRFYIWKQQKVIDHSNTTVYQIKFNTSRWSINRAEDYIEVVCKAIKQHKRKEDKTLIVIHKDLKNKFISALRSKGFKDISIDADQKYNGEDLAVAYFGNIVGRNTWRDFTQIWITAKPIYSMDSYVHFYSFFAGEEILGPVEMARAEGGYGFKEKRFEDIRQGCIVSDIYQAVKRINRDNARSAEIFIVNNHTQVVEEVIKQLKGVRRGENIDLDVTYKDSEAIIGIPKKVNQLIGLLNSLPVGKYKKSDICSMLNWKSDGNLSRLLKNNRIKKLVQVGRIRIHNKSIEIVW